MAEKPIVIGVVKWFDLSKGFGFVVAEGVDEDILLHVNIVRQAGHSGLTAGDRVSIITSNTEKGIQASELVDVEPVHPDAHDAGSNLVADPSERLLPARLKWFDKAKGYGFLNAFGRDEDIFVHVDTLRTGGMIEAAVGEAMCVVVTAGAKGAAATTVYPWDSALEWSVAQDAEND